MKADYFLNYEAEDFVMDDTFRNWVLNPNYELETIVQQYLEANPEQKKVVEDARIIVLSLQVQEKLLPEKEWEEIYVSFQNKLNFASREEIKPTNRSILSWRKYAAVAAVTGIIATILWFYTADSKKQPNSQTYVYATNFGEVKQVVLPDSSVVTINANSKLTLAPVWSDSTMREVWLDGEAFFEVTKKPGNKSKDFFVHTEKLNIQVLGTSFDVKSRTELTRVVLTEGKVKIQSPVNLHEDIMMLPGDAVELKNKQKIPVKLAVRPEYFAAWRNKQFVLNNTSLKDIALFIKEYYGTEVKFETAALEKIKLDGTSLPVEDEKIFLTVIEKATGIKIERTDKGIVIKSK